MKTTWNIIHKEKGNLTKSLRINNHTVHNQINIANELNDYFLNIAGSIGNKRIDKKKKMQLHYKIYLNTLISHLKI